MYEVASQEEQALREELKQARKRLDGLVQDLRTVDTELDGLSTDRRQYRLVLDACGALEALSGLGASGLF